MQQRHEKLLIGVVAGQTGPHWLDPGRRTPSRVVNRAFFPGWAPSLPAGQVVLGRSRLPAFPQPCKKQLFPSTILRHGNVLRGAPDQPELAPGSIETLQAATRVLTGVALRSVDVLDGAVTLPQLRMLAVLAQLGRARSVQVARALGLEASTVTRLADRMVAAGHVTREASRDTVAWSRWS